MRRKRKRLSAACFGICLAIACCLIGVPGYTSGAAAGLQTTELVTAPGADIAVQAGTATNESYGNGIFGGGLTIASDTQYAGSINGVFEEGEPFALRFGFFDDGTNTYNRQDEFTFTIADVTDPDNSFRIRFNVTDNWGSSGYTGAHVYYGDEVRTACYWDGEPYNVYSTTEKALHAPQFPGCSNGQVLQGRWGVLSLEWTGDVLSVRVPSLQNGNDYGQMRTIAKFDGTETFARAGTSKDGWSGTTWGLPELSFPEGYTVSFETGATAPDVYFHSIRSGEAADSPLVVDFTKEAQEAEPAFYTRYRNTPVWEIDAFGFAETYIGAEITIPAATVSLPGGASETLTEAVLTDGIGSQTVTPGGAYTVRTNGLHTITYTTTLGDGNAHTATRTFYAYAQPFGIEDVVTADGAAITYTADRFGYTGITVGAAMTEPTAYTGRIGGVFAGDALVEFTFPHAYFEDGAQPRTSTFTFSVNDLSGEKVFDIVYTSNGGYWTQTYVRYGDEIRTAANNGDIENWSYKTYYLYKAPGPEQQLMAPAISVSAGNETKRKTATFGLQWRDDVLDVTAVNREGSSFVIASFDGSAKPAADVIGQDGYMRLDTENPTWGLDKLYERLKNGYTISFAYDGRGIVPVTFTRVNGIALAGREYLVTDYAFSAALKPADAQIIGGEIYMPEGLSLGAVKRVYSTAFMGASEGYAGSWGLAHAVYETDAEETYDMQIDTDTPDTYTLTIDGAEEGGDDYEGMTVTLTVHVEEAEVLTFDSRGGETVASIVWSEHTRSRLALPDIERLFWQFDGWFSDAEYLTPATIDGITGTATVYAKWSDVTPPTIAFADGIADYASVPAGVLNISAADVIYGDSARPDEAVLTVRYRLAGESDYTDIADPATGVSIQLAAGGSCEIVYTVSDGINEAAALTRTVTAYARTAPVVTMDEHATFGYTGLPFAVGSATAVDADGAAVTVTTTVTRDGVVVETDGGTFTPDAAGTYTVTYTAADGDLIGTASYTFEIADDTSAPVISNVPQAMSVTAGSRVDIAAVTVTDNAYDGLTAEVTVTYGTENVTVTDNAFTAEKVGTYIVHYKATDGAGNITEEMFTVTVAAAAPKEGGCGCGGAAAGWGSLAAALACMGLAALVFVKKSKCI